jgi:hypothetical protein
MVVSVTGGIVERRPVIGIIGGGDRRREAQNLGADAAACRAILLTGGTPNDDDNVKNAAMFGFRNAMGSMSGLIGILPSCSTAWDTTSSPGSLFLSTGLTSYARDPINGLTPDVVIAFRGGEGTLCELAFAALAKKQILFADSRAHHYKKFLEHRQAALKVALTDACDAYPVFGGRKISPNDLMSLLNAMLCRDGIGAIKYSVSALQKALAALLRPLDRTGFPGLPNMPSSKDDFESIVSAMSQRWSPTQ